MARKRYNEEDILRLLREIDVHLHGGMDVMSACRTAGISDKTYYGWRKRYGGMGRAKYYSGTSRKMDYFKGQNLE